MRDGYIFEFYGLNCSRPPTFLTMFGSLCDGVVYAAQPTEPAPPGAPSFAYFSADDRIHYRSDAKDPTVSDPTVDNPRHVNFAP